MAMVFVLVLIIGGVLMIAYRNTPKCSECKGMSFTYSTNPNDPVQCDSCGLQQHLDK